MRGGTGYVLQQKAVSEEMEREEKQLQVEFEWILQKEVHEVLNHVRQILQRCAQRFRGGELVKPEKFILKSILGGENLKCVATLLGEVIYEAGSCLKRRPRLHEKPSDTDHACVVVVHVNCAGVATSLPLPILHPASCICVQQDLSNRQQGVAR